MAVGEYSFRLQEGITGGFAPPTPNLIHTVTQPLNSATLTIATATRPAGTPELQDFGNKFLPKTDETSKLVEELHSILKELPTEVPPGSQDIYGLDTSIAWGSDDLEWFNGGPQGCGGGVSEVQATEEQKAKFKRAVDIVKELAEKKQD